MSLPKFLIEELTLKQISMMMLEDSLPPSWCQLIMNLWMAISKTSLETLHRTLCFRTHSTDNCHRDSHHWHSLVILAPLRNPRLMAWLKLTGLHLPLWSEKNKESEVKTWQPTLDKCFSKIWITLRIKIRLESQIVSQLTKPSKRATWNQILLMFKAIRQREITALIKPWNPRLLIVSLNLSQ